jgi:hypothetical protein
MHDLEKNSHVDIEIIPLFIIIRCLAGGGA